MPRNGGRRLETIDTDLPCMRCGYNLRTLSKDGVCPECGEATGSTLAWLKPRSRLRHFGIARLNIALGAIRRAIVAWAIALVAGELLGRELFRPNSATDAIWMLLPLSALVLGNDAAWRLFGVLNRPTQWILRSLIIVGLAGFALAWINSRWLTFYFGKATDNALIGAAGARFDALSELGTFGMYAHPIVLIACYAIVTRLSQLARGKWPTTAAALIGIIFAIHLANFALFVNRKLPYLGGDVVRAMVGPLGATMEPWASGLQRSIVWMSNDVGNVPLMPPAVLCIAGIANLALLLWLHEQVTRAIQLGELPAASSRSSLSPRPPA